MLTTWQHFLCEQGAELDQHHQISFGDARHSISALKDQNVLASLDHVGAIYVSGTDAKTFLQSQLSNDINLLDEAHAHFSAYCNPKGRIFAYFLVAPYRDGYVLLLPREILTKILARLRMFVLRSAVTLEEVTEQTVCLGLIGTNVETNLPANWPVLPRQDYEVVHHELDLLVRIPGPVSRYLLITTLAAGSAIWHELSTRFTPSGASVWHWCDIQAGLPSVWTQTVEEFVPQMVNLDLIGGVSFKKGCYPGQEIVARMHYLGKAKRRMFYLHTTSSELPAPGTDIYQADGDGQSAGKVVIAQPAQGEGTDLLAVMQLSQIKSVLHLGHVGGATLRVLPLPYTIPDEI